MISVAAYAGHSLFDSQVDLNVFTFLFYLSFIYSCIIDKVHKFLKKMLFVLQRSNKSAIRDSSYNLPKLDISVEVYEFTVRFFGSNLPIITHFTWCA